MGAATAQTGGMTMPGPAFDALLDLAADHGLELAWGHDFRGRWVRFDGWVEHGLSFEEAATAMLSRSLLEAVA